MAKFCVKCGKPLADGEICSCQTQAAAETTILTEPVKETATAEQPQVQAQPQPQGQPQQQWNPQGQPQGQPQQQWNPQGQPQQQWNPQGQPQQQWNPQGQPQPQWSQPQGQPQRTREAEWLNQKTSAFVSGTKNMFANILPIMKKPSETTRELASTGSVAVGLQLMIAKTVVAFIILMIVLISINNSVGSYVSIPWFRFILLLFIVTIGSDCLEAVILKTATGVGNETVSMGSMFTAVGVRALYDTIVLVVGCIALKLSLTFGLAVITIGTTCLTVLGYNAYCSAAVVSENKRVYIYMVSKAVLSLIMLLIVYFMIEGLAGNLIGGLGNLGDLFY